MHLSDGMTREDFGENHRFFARCVRRGILFLPGFTRIQATILVLSPDPGPVITSGQPVWRSASFPVLAPRSSP